MKHYHYSYYLSIFFLISPYIHAMEIENSNTHSDEATAIIISRYIDSVYHDIGLYVSKTNSLSLSDDIIITIINSIYKYDPNIKITEALLNWLSQRNKLFRNAINCCLNYANHNRDTVDATTIAVIENLERKKPGRFFDEIHEDIKNILLNNAFYSDHSYVSGFELHDNITIDLNALFVSNDRSITAIPTNSRTIEINNYPTEKNNPISNRSYRLPEYPKDRDIRNIFFNPNGKYFCIIQDKNSNIIAPDAPYFIITEIETSTLKETYQLFLPNKSFAYYTDNRRLAIYHNQSPQKDSLLTSLKKYTLENWNTKTKECEGKYSVPLLQSNPPSFYSIYGKIYNEVQP